MKYIKGAHAFIFLAIVGISFVHFSTAEAATSISTCTALQNIPSTGLNGDYVLSGDIDCSGISSFSPIGTFTGTLDGQGYTISNFRTHGGLFSDKVAMFSATNGAVIRNLSITNADVLGYTKVAVLVGEATNTVITNVAVSSGTTLFGLGSGTDNAGGLVGYASNTLISYSHASIPLNVGGSNVGGLVGSANSGTIISKSYSTGNVACTSNNGSNCAGLVGLNDSSTIIDSYSTSFVGTGIFWVNAIGGLVGTNNGSTALINRSYAANGFNVNGSAQGLVGSQTNSASTTNSFWDTQASGAGSSAAGTGKNTSEMQTQGTFVSGWNFTNTWIIGGYPSLRAGDVTAPTTPTSLTAVATGLNVHLAWTNPTDNDFVSVYVRRDTANSPSDILTGTGILSASTATSYDDNALAEAVYYYSVIAIDSNGNYSIPARATVRVDTTPTPAPMISSSVTVGSVVTINWTNPGDADFATITIVRKTGGYPSNPTDGTVISTGLTGTSYPDTVPADGTYYYSLFAYDTTGNVSTAAQIIGTVDTVLPVLTTVTAVRTPNSSATPSYTFTSTKVGGITYGGSCASAISVASIGSNTITFNALADGTYADCTIVVRDTFGNNSLTHAIPTFTIDTVAPTLTPGAEVGQNIYARDAVYTFTTTEAGTYTIGSCSGVVDASAHTVRFPNLTPGAYASCTLSESDFAGNLSNTISIPSFSIRALPQNGHAPAVVEAAATNGKLGFTASTPKINSKTGNTETVLTFNADPKTVQGYAISFDPTLSDTGIASYNPTTTIIIPNTNTPHTLYMKYYSTTGKATPLLSQTIGKKVTQVAAIKKAPIKKVVAKKAPIKIAKKK